jgi:pimeloyl-ACP methyl ester carboxylesterase
MDYWDPALTDGLARDRGVILFNNAGVSSSSGEVPTTFEQMGANAIAFSRAIGLNKVDVLGFSIGGMVAQEMTLQAPDLVRKLILVGTGPRGDQGMDSLTRVAQRIFSAAYDPPEHVWLAAQFSPSEAGQAAGKEFLKRKHLRQQGRDPEVNDKVAPAAVVEMICAGVVEIYRLFDETQSEDAGVEVEIAGRYSGDRRHVMNARHGGPPTMIWMPVWVSNNMMPKRRYGSS